MRVCGIGGILFQTTAGTLPPDTSLQNVALKDATAQHKSEQKLEQIKINSMIYIPLILKFTTRQNNHAIMAKCLHSKLNV